MCIFRLKYLVPLSKWHTLRLDQDAVKDSIFLYLKQRVAWDGKGVEC